MKTNFRKVVSVVCAIAMLLSLCTVSFINTASAAIVGTTEDTYEQILSYDFDNATGVGHVRFVDKVEYKDGAVHVKNSENGGALYFAADPDDGATFTEDKTAAKCELLKLEAGTRYKITFKYKYLAGTTDASVSLYQAKTPDAASVSDNGVIAGSADQTMDSDITAENPLTEDETTWRNYEFVFTPASSEHCIGIKPAQPHGDRKDDFLIDDVVIYKCEAAQTVITDMKYLADLYAQGENAFDDNGSTMNGAFGKRADGVTYDATTEATTFYVSSGNWNNPDGWDINFTIKDKAGNALFLEKGINYAISVEYKVLESTNKGHLGFAHARGTNTGGTPVTHLASMDYAAGYVSTDWEEYTAIVDSGDLAKTSLRLLFGGANNKVAIKNVTVTAAKPGYTFVEFNDNGNITNEVVKIGDTITKVGNNKYNAETLREEFIGWYADPNFTTPVTNYTAEYTTLYAKYPSVVLDFNVLNSWTDDKATYYDAAFSDGKMTIKYTSSGFMIPAYDAALDSASNDSYYKFVPGVTYKLTFIADSFKVYNDSDESPTTANMRFLNGNQAQGGSGRKDENYGIVVINDATKNVEKEFTFKNTQDTNLHGIAVSITSNSATVEAVFDKIIITQVSGMDQYKLGSVTFVDGGKTVATYTATDKFVCAPTLKTPDGKLFIGWYDASYNAEKGGTKSAASAPVSFAKVAKGVHVTYEARYIDDATTVIDFDIYGTKSGWTDYVVSNGTRSKNVKVTDSGNGDFYLETEHVGLNNFKSSLFDADGKKFFVYEGVEYEVTVDYEVNTEATDHAIEGSFIGLTRNYIDSFQPQAIHFDDGSTRLETLADATKKGRHTVTKSFTVSDIHVAYDGSVEGGAAARQTELSLLLYGGAVKVYSVSITPKSYTSVFTPEYDATKGKVTFSINDDGSVSVGATPKEGYVLAANGVKVVRTFKSFVKVNNDEDVKVTDGPSYGYALNTSDGKNFEFKLSDLSADVLRTASLKVDFVAADATDNAAFIGASVRNPEGTFSAGIRFRARISDATVKAADKIEFVVVPETELPESGLVKDYTGTMAVTGFAYENGGKNTVYNASIDGFTDYQVCVTGLTETTMAWNLAAAVKITYTDNTVMYFQITNNQSYNGLNK